MPREIGLPRDLSIRVPDTARLRKPMRVLDELDREITREAAAQPAPAARVEAPPSPQPYRAPEASPSASTTPPEVEPAYSIPIPTARDKKKPIRKELSLEYAVAKNLEDLVEHFKRYSVQKDISASEIIGALILALYDSRAQLSLGQIPPRGQWGSVNARNFRANMKSAVASAISATNRGGAQ